MVTPNIQHIVELERNAAFCDAYMHMHRLVSCFLMGGP